MSNPKLEEHKLSGFRLVVFENYDIVLTKTEQLIGKKCFLDVCVQFH